MASIKPSTASSSVGFVGTVGSQIIYIERTPHVDATGQLTPELGDYTVKALDRSGRVTTLDTLGTHRLAWEVMSPDGTQMLWTDLISYSAHSPAHSELHLTTFGEGDRVVAAYQSSEQEPYGMYVIAGYRWDAAGAIVAHRAAGWPMPRLVADVWDAYILDPGSSTLSPLWPGSTCTLPARAADGTVACVVQGSRDSTGDYLLNIGKPPHVTYSIRVEAEPGLGSLSFRPGSSPSQLVIGLMDVCGGYESGAYDYCFGPTRVVDLKTGSVQPFGPSGLVPPNGSWAWLDDGSLLEYRYEPAHFDPATTAITSVTYVVSPVGSARPLTVGEPLGVLRG